MCALKIWSAVSQGPLALADSYCCVSVSASLSSSGSESVSSSKHRAQLHTVTHSSLESSHKLLGSPTQVKLDSWLLHKS